MNRMLIAIAIVGGAVMAHAAPGDNAPPLKGGSFAVTETETTAKVVKVDQSLKTVTIKAPMGKRVTIGVPDDVQDLTAIKAGSMLKIKYVQAEALAIAKPGETPVMEEATAHLAPIAGTPAEVVVNTKHITGSVLDIDRANRELTLKGPAGSRMTLKVPDDVSGFDQAKVGDTVALTYSDAIAVMATPASMRQPMHQPMKG